MRIAALMAADTVSGPGRQLAAVAQRLETHGVAVRVVLLQRHAARAPFAQHLERCGVPCDVVEDRGPLDWGTVRRVRDLLERESVSLIQTHGYKPTAVGYALRRSHAPQPWLAFFHGATDKNLKDRFYHAVERRMLLAADRIVVVSTHQKHMFNGHAGRVAVVHNAVVPLTDETDTTLVLEKVCARDRPVIGVIGRLSHEKGVDVFLRACAELRAQGVVFSAVVAGDGPERLQLERLAQQLGIANDVHFLGHVTAPAGLYQQLDLLVLPSRSEGLPNVLLEALGADVPVVATAVGAVPDVLCDPDAGVLVPPGDVQALAGGILQGLTHGGSAAAAGARRAAVGQFSLDHRVDQHLALYRELMGLELACAG